MLTLQNILDNDTIATMVAKLNANFQTIALSNGGPQGVRGEQGIPGLPGKQGSTGPTGPAGATGPAPGLIPFSVLGTLTAGGGTGSFTPAPSYNDLSYQFLATGPNEWGPYGAGPTSLPVVQGQLYFDNNQLGWWKYLAVPDPTPSTDGGTSTIGGNSPETYVESPYYDFTNGGAWTGPDWYWYPINTASIVQAAQGIWASDKTNYLGRITGSEYSSPSTIIDVVTGEPFEIANARMVSKFGSIFISSIDKDPVEPGQGGGNSDNDSSYIFSYDLLDLPRLVSGVDRMLFKMSIDGVRYFDNMKARGYRFNDTGAIIGVPYTVAGGTNVPGINPPDPTAAGVNETLFPRPLYGTSIDAYSPILFFSQRNDTQQTDAAKFGYFQLTPNTGDLRVHLFTTRDAGEFFDSGGVAVDLESTTNYGEVLFDVRRLMTSNQYLNMMPQDTESFKSVTRSNITSLGLGTSLFPSGPSAASVLSLIEEWTSPYAWRTYQGYHSVFTGQMIADLANSGNQLTYDAYNNWVYKDRQSWYGTSLFAQLPNASDTSGGAPEELVRSAGLMVKARASAGSTSNFTDEVYIYTSNYVTGPTSESDPNQNLTGYDYDGGDASDGRLQSLPVARFTAKRNVGIGTFTWDKTGMFDPSARLHVHADWRPDAEMGGRNDIHNYDASLGGVYSGIDKSWLTYTDYPPIRRLKSAAFTIERVSPQFAYGAGVSTAVYGSDTTYATGPGYFDDWYNRGVFNDIVIGAVTPPWREFPGLANGAGATGPTYFSPSAGIRYESFNFTLNSGGAAPISKARWRKNFRAQLGWFTKGALRLGVTPYINNTASTANTYEIGAESSLQSIDYQLTFSPLASAQTLTSATQALSGVGIHNLYPRARVHIGGKNLYPEYRFDEEYSPGFAQNDTNAIARSTWNPLPSSRQIVIDYINDWFIYNAGIKDYSYDYGVTLSSPAVSYNVWSPNTVNYPSRELGYGPGGYQFGTTRRTFNNTTNYAAGNTSMSAGSTPAGQSLHGGNWNAYLLPDKYIGFNLFRNLLGNGDYFGEADDYNFINTDTNNGVAAVDSVFCDLGASSWRTGNRTDTNEKNANGGSALFADSDGNMMFSFISKDRQGTGYQIFEQTGIGQREVLDNIKIIFDSSGNIGIGNSPGTDEDAYQSLYWNPDTGKINYLPNANGASVNPTINAPISYDSDAGGSWSPNRLPYTPPSSSWYTGADVYGFANATSNYTTYTNPYQAAQINYQATRSETIRLEVAAEKAMSRVGHHIEQRGWGYPGIAFDVGGLPVGSGTVITITDNSTNKFATRYLGVPASTAAWANAVWTFSFDNMGRAINMTVDLASAPSGISNGEDILSELGYTFTAPHPAEWGEDGPWDFANGSTNFAWRSGISHSITYNGSSISSGSWLIPAGACPFVIDTLIYSSTGSIATATFKSPDIQKANIRLNNYTLGDGYLFTRSDGHTEDDTSVEDSSLAATQAVFAGRTESPKMLFTFGAVDYTNLNAQVAAATLSSTELSDLIAEGKAPLMKVTTVLESAMTTSTLRTYALPNGDNTGGTLLSITDHMGSRERDEPGLVPLPGQNTITDKLRVERVVSYEVQRVGLKSDPTVGAGFTGVSQADFSYEMLPVTYANGSIYNDSGWQYTAGVENSPYFPSYIYSNTLNPDAYAVAELNRNINAYWSVSGLDSKSETLYDAYSDENIQSNLSEIRYRRINDNYVLIDFNLTLNAEQVLLNAKAGFVDDAVLFGSGLDLTRGIKNVIHSPYTCGTFVSQLTTLDSNNATLFPAGIGTNDRQFIGIDGRWVQYARFVYDIGKDVEFDNGATVDDDPDYYENNYGGGANFLNWNEFRGWYPGTAITGVRSFNTSNVETFNNIVDDSNYFDGVTDAYWADNNRDGSPYLRTTRGGTYAYTGTSSADLWFKTWNGRFPDWYWSTYAGDRYKDFAPVTPNDQRPAGNYGQRVFDWGTIGERIIASNRVNAINLTDPAGAPAPQWYSTDQNIGTNPYYGSGMGVSNNASGTAGSDYPSGTWTTEQAPTNGTSYASISYGSFYSNPWIEQYQEGLGFDSDGLNSIDSPKPYEIGRWNWFKQSLAHKQGYRNLMNGWYQWIKQGFSWNASSSTAYYAVCVSVPQYYNAVVWRSFGDDAFNRSGNMQWRAYPYRDAVAPNSADINNTIAIEVMLDKPLYVSGAKRAVLKTANDLCGVASPKLLYQRHIWPFETFLGNADYDDYVKWGITENPVAGEAPMGVNDNGGTGIVSRRDEVLRKIDQETRFFLGTPLSSMTNYTSYQPYGNITFRGQAIVKYRKTRRSSTAP